MDATFALLTPCDYKQTFEVIVESYNPDELPPEAAMVWPENSISNLDEVPSCKSLFKKTVQLSDICEILEDEVTILIVSFLYRLITNIILFSVSVCLVSHGRILTINKANIRWTANQASTCIANYLPFKFLTTTTSISHISTFVDLSQLSRVNTSIKL
jgi:hypothetical protein